MKLSVIFFFIIGALIAQNTTETFLTTKNGLILKAKYTVPEGKVKGAVLMIQGSGPTDMDGNSAILPLKFNYFKDLSEELTNAGYATFRYNKRGSVSTRTEVKVEQLRFEDMVEDAQLALEKMQSFGVKKVYLLGHSQGALIATLLAQKNKIKGLVVVAGAGFPLDFLLKHQLRDVLGAQYALKNDTILEQIRKGQEVSLEELTPELFAVAQPNVQGFVQSWMQYDPAQELTKVKVPVMLLYGGYDQQVPIYHGEQLKMYQPKASFVAVQNMNHLLLEVSNDEESAASYQKGGKFQVKSAQLILAFLTQH